MCVLYKCNMPYSTMNTLLGNVHLRTAYMCNERDMFTAWGSRRWGLLGQAIQTHTYAHIHIHIHTHIHAHTKYAPSQRVASSARPANIRPFIFLMHLCADSTSANLMDTTPCG